ncbi:6-phosphogluconolactonase [Marinimicrobium alkaliphilum]|uniref:6-phosphogluconolactonase n=1 Tax=Marinimicrobium alkaliphilum TaxID=2202654 RepID=UPI000DBAA69D|nr:6-phosphogluconolactonase [Marinimicrobium alkaliphilum]
MVTERLFDTREALVAALTDDCAAQLRRALDAGEEASFLASGGSTPAQLYEALSKVDSLDWSKVTVALVDERWVDFDHDKSNEAFVARTFRQNAAADIRLLGMKNAEFDPKTGLNACEMQYQQLKTPFDVTILGLGKDGHTASLFPHAEGLSDALDPDAERLCAAIKATPSEVTGDYVERMTLNLNGLLKARELVLLITGDDKLETLRAAQAGDDVEAMPIRAILRQTQVPVTVYWAP